MTPLSDGDFINESLVAVVDSVCHEERSVFESVRLSSSTVRRRIEEMSDKVHDSLKIRISTLVAFSLALDESTDTEDTAQLAVFIRGVTADLNVCEEFHQSITLRGTTTGKDIFDAMLRCVGQYSLDFSRLVCVTSDGAPAMIGQKKGAASLLVRHCEADGHIQPIHTQVLSTSSFLGFRLSFRPTSCSGKSNLALALKRLPAPALQHDSMGSLVEQIFGRRGMG